MDDGTTAWWRCTAFIMLIAILSGCSASADGSADGNGAVANSTEGNGWPAPAAFVASWNAAASSRLDVLNLLDANDGDERLTMMSADHTYFLGYEKKSRGYNYIAEPNDQVKDIVARCAAMVHVLDPRLSQDEATEFVIHAGQAANPISTRTVDSLKFSIVTHGATANCFGFPAG